MKKADQEEKETDAKDEELVELTMVQDALFEFKAERELMAKNSMFAFGSLAWAHLRATTRLLCHSLSDHQFLAYLDNIVDQNAEFATSDAIITRFSSLMSTHIALDSRRIEVEARIGDISTEIAGLKDEAVQRGNRTEIEAMRTELETTVGETKKLNKEVSDILAKHGDKMGKLAEAQRFDLFDRSFETAPYLARCLSQTNW